MSRFDVLVSGIRYTSGEQEIVDRTEELFEHEAGAR
jgi:hypothetical protein